MEEEISTIDLTDFEEILSSTHWIGLWNSNPNTKDLTDFENI